MFPKVHVISNPTRVNSFSVDVSSVKAVFHYATFVDRIDISLLSDVLSSGTN